MPIDGASGIRSMSSTAPTYTHDNFLLACQLHWLVSIYWRYEIFDSTGADHLKSAVEPKKIQIHSHRFSNPGISEATARHMRDAILEVSRDHDYQLSRGAILPDHIDLIVGCPLDETPADVALQYLNRLSDNSGRQQIFRFSASVSTFGEDDLDGME
jgi:hypothetical protein